MENNIATKANLAEIAQNRKTAEYLKAKRKTRKIFTLCNIMGWGIMLYIFATIGLIMLNSDDNPNNYDEVVVFIWSLIGLVFVLTPLGCAVGVLAIRQIKQAKRMSVEISFWRAFCVVISTILCFMPIVVIGGAILLVPLF